jgi:hypothetical protein
LLLQTRIDADIQTLYSILYYLQQDERNRELFLEEFDEATVDAFFKSDLRNTFFFKVVKGTDQPQNESVNAFKMISFAQNIAPLTGLQQMDPASFYDIVSKIGDSLNIDLGIGAGRRERNLANNKITRIKELYKEMSAQGMLVQADPNTGAIGEQDPLTMGMHLYKAVTMKDMIVLSAISQVFGGGVPSEAGGGVPSPGVELAIYNWDALCESYSDWLQSDEGQSAAVPVQLAVGLLFAYSNEMRDRKKMYEQAQMLSLLPPEETGGEEPSVKSDGSTGPGRPREVSADRYAEGETRETAGE